MASVSLSLWKMSKGTRAKDVPVTGYLSLVEGHSESL